MIAAISLIFLGICIGLILAALFGAAHPRRTPQDLTAAYLAGYHACRRRILTLIPKQSNGD